MNNIKKAFTFVELVVVIAIIAILSVIGFTSYTSHLTTTRDASRKSDLSDIYTLLDSYKMKGQLPIPENKVDIYSNGVIIGYQGYAGASVLSKIGFQNGGKDPLDDSYYTYYLAKDMRNAGVMGFLENNPTENGPTSLYLNTTYAVDYSQRYPVVFGKKMGIIIDANNTPIQENSALQSTGIDVNTTTTQYKAFISSEKSIVGTGTTLQVLYGTTTTGIIGKTCKEYLDENGGLPMKSGWYLLNTSSTGSTQVYCDMSGSGETNRVQICSGTLPSNSFPTNGNTYNQKYDGTNWIPVISWGVVNTSGCDFDCNTGYSWNGTTCLQNITGQCGPNNGLTLLAKPTSGLCANGNPTTVSGSGPWTWSCIGQGTGTNASCSANAVSVCSLGVGAYLNNCRLN